MYFAQKKQQAHGGKRQFKRGAIDETFFKEHVLPKLEVFHAEK